MSAKIPVFRFATVAKPPRNAKDEPSEPFEQKVKEGQDVKKGDLLVVADLDKIKASGRETITPMIICNSDAYEQVETFTGKDVETTDAVMKLHPAK